MYKRCIYFILITILLIIIYHPDRHAKYYPFIKNVNVIKVLVKHRNVTSETNLKNCAYEDVIINNEYVAIDDVFKSYKYVIPNTGGEYKPELCNAQFKTAILVPYRDRREQLKVFLNYMHHFLQKQNIHYRIIIAEQNNTRPFNRAKMFNYAAFEAIKQNFSCLILTDIDLLPITTGNIYACTKEPRHMSSSVDSMRFNLPYLGIVGGVFSILSNQFELVNGMSNIFDGWGGEDDDFYTRLKSHKLLPCRFAPELSRYTMLKHKKQQANPERFKYLKSSLERQRADGLNSLNRNFTVKLERLFTHIYVP